MPSYSYLCSSCNREFEEIRSMTDRQECPCTCGAIAQQTVGRPLLVGSDITGHWRDFSLSGETVKGRKHLKELCRRYNMWAPGVLL